MIPVTDLHGKRFYLNAELIEQVSANPDTQVVLSNGHRVYIAESPDEIAERVIIYRRKCLMPDSRVPPDQGKS